MLIIINYNINITNINITYSWYFIEKHLIDSLKNISKENASIKNTFQMHS